MAARWRGRTTSKDLLRQRLIRSGAYATGEPGSPPLREWLGEPPKAHKVRRTSDDKAVVPTEHQEQSAVIGWWRSAHSQYNLPEFALFAIPNGGARDVITGARLKAEGVRKGVVDLCLPVQSHGFHGWWGELKRRNASPSDIKQEQREFIAYLKDAGYTADVHFSADSVIASIKEYLA